MNEFIEKLIGRLEEIKDDTGKNCSKVAFNKCNKYKNCGVCLADRTIDIVNELAEEYNGGWIPCENELPKENGYYIVTYRKNGELLVDTWYFNGRNFNQVDEIDVIAWQPLPEPYNPKGE